MQVHSVKSVPIKINIDESTLEKESAIYKCDNLTNYMKSVNEESLALVKEDAGLLQSKGKLFDLAKKRVHEKGYQYVKQSSRSKVFGNSNPDNPAKKRKYVPLNIREEQIRDLSESIRSTNETIQLLQKQKEQ